MPDTRVLVKLMLVAFWLGACQAEHAEEVEAEASVERQPEPGSSPEPATQPKPELKAEPAPESNLDVLTASAFEAEIVDVHGGRWTPCGRVHTIGVIEVEVEGAGEPRPRVGLVISCPGDMASRVDLELGRRVRVELHATRPPRWPRPNVELPETLPLRYVRALENLDDAGGE